MNFLIIFISLFLFIIGISMLINYFTTIITSAEISKDYFLTFAVGTIILSTSIFSLVNSLEINLNIYILPLLLVAHLLLYTYCYLFLIILFNIFYFIENVLFYNKFFLKILNIFKIKIRYIFHPNLKLNNQPVYKNLRLLKFLLFLSYFLSVLCFKFFFEISLMAKYEFDNIIKESINTYSNIFIISIIPVFISYFKNIKF